MAGCGRARAVGVLDAQQELAAVVAGEQPVEQRGARAADMQEAGRRGGEAGDDGHCVSWVCAGFAAFRPEKRAVGRRAFLALSNNEGDGVAGARTWILDQLDAERSRWMLWLPVAMGLGIAVYFELPSEPALWLGPALAAGALVLVFLARSGSLARALAHRRWSPPPSVSASSPGAPRAWRRRPSAGRCSASMSRAASPTSSACPRACGSCSRRCA